MNKEVLLVLLIFVAIIATSQQSPLLKHQTTIHHKDEFRDLIGGTPVKRRCLFPYVVYLKYMVTIGGVLNELILTGVALNPCWVAINPNIPELFKADLTGMKIISGTLEPLTSGTEHEIMKNITIPSIPKRKIGFGSVFINTFMLLRVSPRIHIKKFVILPDTPISVNTLGTILQWDAMSRLQSTEKKSVDDAMCSDVFASIRYDAAAAFCTQEDLTNNVCPGVGSDANGVPFITSSHVLSGMMLSTNSCRKEIMVDLGTFSADIEKEIANC